MSLETILPPIGARILPLLDPTFAPLGGWALIIRVRAFTFFLVILPQVRDLLRATWVCCERFSKFHTTSIITVPAKHALADNHEVLAPYWNNLYEPLVCGVIIRKLWRCDTQRSGSEIHVNRWHWYFRSERSSIKPSRNQAISHKLHTQSTNTRLNILSTITASDIKPIWGLTMRPNKRQRTSEPVNSLCRPKRVRCYHIWSLNKIHWLTRQKPFVTPMPHISLLPMQPTGQDMRLTWTKERKGHGSLCASMELCFEVSINIDKVYTYT